MQATVHDAVNLPLGVSQTAFVKWKQGFSRDQKGKFSPHPPQTTVQGVTPSNGPDNDMVRWNHTFRFQACMEVDKETRRLLPLYLRLSLREVALRAVGRGLKLGVVEIDLSEFARTAANTRRFLLESQLNAAVTVTIYMIQIAGTGAFEVPERLSGYR